MLSEKHDNPHKGGTEAYIATEHYNEGWNDAVAALRAQAGAQPVLWWNGLRKVDESDGTAPSFRPIEDTLHDIPLYSGVNPCNIHPAPEAAQALSDWSRISRAAQAANQQYGQWMPERWLQLFVKAYNGDKQ